MIRMNNMHIVKYNIDISYRISKTVIEKSPFSPYQSIYIDPSEVYIHLYDRRLESILVSRRYKIIKAETPKDDVEEVIIQIYPEAVDTLPLNINREDEKFQEEIIKRYPKAFSQHLKMKREAIQIAREYGINMKRVIDEDGLQYTTLSFKLREWSLTVILQKIEKILTIYEEYFKRLNLLDLTYVDEIYREKASRDMDRLYEILKLIIRKLDVVERGSRD